jgi:RNA polymerase sigma factor (sigma-70 family)
MASTVSEPEQTDEQLAAVVARRGESDRALRAAGDAFDRLYHKYAPLLLAFIAARAWPAEPEELHQEVWARVWHHLPDQFRRSESFRGWIYQIARNAILDHAKKHKAETLINPADVPDGRHRSDLDRLLDQEQMAVFWQCLEKLSPAAASVVCARLAGEDYPELCRRLKLKSDQAYKVFHDAKKQLTTCVERALR